MSDTDNPIPTAPDPIALITKAGKLNETIDQTVSIVRSHNPTLSKNTFQDLLTSVGSDEYEAYHTGKESGIFDVESGLHDAAA